MRLRNKETEEIKEQEIFMGDFPDDQGRHLLVINGAERHRLPDRPLPGMYLLPTEDTRPAASPTPPPSSLPGRLAGV